MSPNPKQMVPVQDWQRERPARPANQTWQQTVVCLRMIAGRLKRMKLARCQNARTAANHHSHSRWSKEPRRDTSGEPQFPWKLKLSFSRLAAKGFGACQHMSITVNLESEANYINPTKYDSYSFPYLTKHYFIKNDRWASSFFKTLPKGKTDPSTLTHSTPLVQSRRLNKLWNLGQTSAWFCLEKGEKYIEKLWHFHVATYTNPCNN